MRIPIHTPISDEAERVAALLLKLETSPAPDFVVTPFAVRTGAVSEGKVVVRLDDGGREQFSPAQARFLARAILADGAYVEASQHADSLLKAADEAERRASSGALTHGVGGERDHSRLAGFWR